MNSSQQTYTVRKMTGRGSDKWNVYKGSQRVNVHAHRSETGAKMEADDLNISAMVKDYSDDPRPYAVRLAEAAAAYSVR